MSRRSDPRWQPLARLRPSQGEEGFSLVEVLVAMLIFAVIAVASLGFIMTSLSATSLARTDGVAKNLNQERLEKMRNLPYFTHANVSSVPDLLDIYYTSTTAAATSTSSTGFVSATSARDTSKGDPASGAFYRRVFAADPKFPAYTQRVTAQFMEDATKVLPNPVFESTSVGGTGLPPSKTIGVRVTTLWTIGGKAKRFTIDSQIADGAVKAPLVTLQARMSLLRVAGVLPDSRELVAEAGALNLDGSLSTTTVASAVVQAASASVANGERKVGSSGSLAAPPTKTLSVAGVGPLTLPVSGVDVASFGNTSVTGLAVSSDAGQPGAGSATAPITTFLHGAGSGVDYFRTTNVPDAGTRLGFDGSPVISAASASCGGSCEAVKASGSLVSVGGAAHSATASLGGSIAGTVSVFRTATSPEGVIKVRLSSLAITCESRAGASPPGSVSVTYSGTVSHRTYDATTGAYGYSTPVVIDSTMSSDPLAAIDLQTVVGVDGSGLPLRLADYVQSWSSLTSTAVSSSTVLATNGSAASINVPGVLTLSSKPLRTAADSTIGLQLGAASCTAGDIR